VLVLTIVEVVTTEEMTVEVGFEEGIDDACEILVEEGATEEVPGVNLGDFGFGIREGEEDEDDDFDDAALTSSAPTVIVRFDPRNRLSKLETTAKEDLGEEGAISIEAATTARLPLGFEEMRDRRSRGVEGGGGRTAERLVLGLGTTTGSPRDLRSREGIEEVTVDRFVLGLTTATVDLF